MRAAIFTLLALLGSVAHADSISGYFVLNGYSGATETVNLSFDYTPTLTGLDVSHMYVLSSEGPLDISIDNFSGHAAYEYLGFADVFGDAWDLLYRFTSQGVEFGAGEIYQCNSPVCSQNFTALTSGEFIDPPANIAEPSTLAMLLIGLITLCWMSNKTRSLQRESLSLAS